MVHSQFFTFFSSICSEARMVFKSDLWSPVLMQCLKNKCEHYNVRKRLETYTTKHWVTQIFFKLGITVNLDRQMHSPCFHKY